jgi:hypothetical protein
MIANHSVNQGFLAKLPAAPKGAVTFPSMTQVNTAKATIASNWASTISGS